MQPTMTDAAGLSRTATNFWIYLVAAASVAFSIGLACATPLAAVACAAALTLSLRNALYASAVSWVSNQLVGYVFLAYPQAFDSFAWGAVIGLATMVATILAYVAVATLSRFGALGAALAAFAASFMAYEMMLLAFAAAVGGMENFSLVIVVPLFAINALAFTGFCALTACLNLAIGARTVRAGRHA